MLGHPPVRCVSISCSLPAGRYRRPPVGLLV